MDQTKPSIYIGRQLEPVCVNLEQTDCNPEGPIFDTAHYMCNGMCIPAYIPCNNTCLDNVLWRTNRREKLFGPHKCTGFDRDIPEANKIYLQSILGFDGYCVPGSLACNGSCTTDLRRSLLKEGRRGQSECVEACSRTKERPCNGTCVKNDEVCGNSCGNRNFYCNGECVYKNLVCNGDPDCENGEDEENCPEDCPLNTWSKVSIGFEQDGKKYCIEEDEMTDKNCNDKMKCDNGTRCIPLYDINDGTDDCVDGTDENVEIDMSIKLYDDDRHVYKSDYLWLCDGNIKNMSDPCNGECNGDMKICLNEDGSFKCIPNHQVCPREGCGFLRKRCNGTDEQKNDRCVPFNQVLDNYVCEESYDWNMTIVDSNGRECKYHKR